MADAAALADETEEQPSEVKPKRSLLPLILIALVILGGGAAAAWFFVLAPGDTDEEANVTEEATHGDPLYFTLAENLVVNFRSQTGTRYLQVGIDLMTYDPEGVHALEQHAPVLQSNLILLLSDQSQEELMTREGKEALRAEALSDIRSTMKELYGSPVAEDLYFTSFVMQ